MALLLVGLVALSCQTTPNLVALMPQLVRDYELSDDELRSMQYYISERLVLEKRVVRGAGEIERGKLITRDGRTLQQVVIEFNTPGIVERASLVGPTRRGHSIEVSFDRGAPLEFAARTTDRYYTLAGASSGGLFAELFKDFGVKRSARALFSGSEWNVVAGMGAKLLIEQDALGELVESKRVLRGLRVPRD